MNILFLSIGEFGSLEGGSVHIDVVKQLSNMGHTLYVVCKTERRNGLSTHMETIDGINLLRVKTGNIKNTNIIEKGISTILLEYQFLWAIKKYLRDIKFDLVLYHTPPITFTKVIQYVKRRDRAKSYLLLKDIFPQNSVDLGMFKQNSLLYKYFRNKEKMLYNVSDRIGCMSQANVHFIIKNNPTLSDKVEICPNSTFIKDDAISVEEKLYIREKYNLPKDKLIFVYGGNLGRPQGVPFIIECLRACSDIPEAIFLIIGGGTDFYKLDEFVRESKTPNVVVMNSLPKIEYELMVKSCDVGMIFLDYRFTIPNYPSRILSYMQAKMPIFAVTDRCTDVGIDIVEGDFGWWAPSNDVNIFRSTILNILKEDIKSKGLNAYRYMCENFDVKKSSKVIEDSMK